MIALDGPRLLPLRSASVISTVSVAGLLSLVSPLKVNDVNALLIIKGHKHDARGCTTHESLIAWDNATTPDMSVL